MLGDVLRALWCDHRPGRREFSREWCQQRSLSARAMALQGGGATSVAGVSYWSPRGLCGRGCPGGTCHGQSCMADAANHGLEPSMDLDACGSHGLGVDDGGAGASACLGGASRTNGMAPRAASCPCTGWVGCGGRAVGAHALRIALFGVAGRSTQWWCIARRCHDGALWSGKRRLAGGCPLAVGAVALTYQCSASQLGHTVGGSAAGRCGRLGVVDGSGL